jgi:cytochrome c
VPRKRRVFRIERRIWAMRILHHSGWHAAVALVALLSGACGQRDEPRVTVPDSDTARGRHLLHSYGCGTCHIIPGVSGANGQVARPLHGIADRGYIAGVLPNTPDAMIDWLVDPPAFATRTMMPNVGATRADARDMAAYLYTLRAEPRTARSVRGFIERFTGAHVVPLPPEVEP